MGVIQQLERVCKDLNAVADLLETETIDSKTASELIKKVIKTITS